MKAKFRVETLKGASKIADGRTQEPPASKKQNLQIKANLLKGIKGTRVRKPNPKPISGRKANSRVGGHGQAYL